MKTKKCVTTNIQTSCDLNGLPAKRDMVELKGYLTCACGHETVATTTVRRDLATNEAMAHRSGVLLTDFLMDLQVLHEELGNG